METITVYTDGGVRNNQSRENVGAWAYAMTYKNKLKEDWKVEKNTTNNIQELKAVIEALKAIKTRNIPIEIYTDSQYVCSGVNEWMKGWKKKGWKTSAKKPVKNVELWKELDKLIERQETINIHKVLGHSNVEGNERVDLLVNMAMDELI